MSAVDIGRVRHAFGTAAALHDISLAVPEGSYTVFLGPSGSGKTTLLNLIGGFLPLQAGTITIDGRDVAGLPPARRPTATVFQDYALFPHMNVAANVAFGLRMAGRPAVERRARVAEMLYMVGLGEAGRRRPHQLSGGQRQRVALARALAVSPKVLLLDEPLGALDLALRHQMQAELKRIQREVGSTFIHVTHDQDEAMALADQLVVMNAGAIEDVGPPETVYARPATRFTAGFVGRSNILSGTVSRIDGGMAVVETAIGPLTGADHANALRPGVPAAIVLRPEHIARADPTDPAQAPLADGHVMQQTFAGAHRDGEVAVGEGTRLTVQFSAREPVALGPIALGYTPQDAVALPDPEPAP